MKDKSIRIDYHIWSLAMVKATELKIKTGRNITIKKYIERAVKEKLGTSPDLI